MIGSTVAAIVLAQAQTFPEFPVVERPVAGSSSVVYQVYIKADFETARQKAAWQILEYLLLEGCDEFTAQDVRSFGSAAGRLPKVYAMDGFMRIQFVARAGDSETVGRLLAMTILAPKLREDDFLRAKLAAKAKEGDPFLTGLEQWNLDFDDVLPKDVSDLWYWIIRQGNLRIYVSGAVEIGQTAEIFRRAQRGMKRELGQRPPRYAAMARPAVKSGIPAGVYELQGKPITPSSEYAAARVLALFALGVGKDCSMVRVLREDRGWSYIQELVFWPTNKGWVPRMVMFRDGEEGANMVGEIRTALTVDVDGWTEQTLYRALKLAQASMRGEWGQSPFWLDHSGPMYLDEVGVAALYGFMDMAGSGGVTLDTWAQTLQNVDLETMKVQAKKLLDEASGAYREGS